MITALGITSHELVNLHARVSSSACHSLIGLNGTVLDETKSMLLLGTTRGTRWVPKSHSTFEFSPVENSTLKLDGKRILGRPHSRLGAKR